jgi:hypothetical protein
VHGPCCASRGSLPPPRAPQVQQHLVTAAGWVPIASGGVPSLHATQGAARGRATPVRQWAAWCFSFLRPHSPAHTRRPSPPEGERHTAGGQRWCFNKPRHAPTGQAPARGNGARRAAEEGRPHTPAHTRRPIPPEGERHTAGGQRCGVHTIMIHPQVHLRIPCYDFSFL